MTRRAHKDRNGSRKKESLEKDTQSKERKANAPPIPFILHA